jgi:hypothetical protein
MLNKGLIFLSFLILVVAIPLTVYLSEVAEVKAENKVAYQLPYPGILPDHPLYFLKTLRDRLHLFFNRSLQKKAEIYLLYSDKRVASAQILLEKGKEKMALDTLAKGEKYFFEIPFLMEQAKKQGQSFPKELIEKIKTANEKHAEVIDDFLKKVSQGQNVYLLEIKKINDEIKKKLTSF